MRLNLRAGPVHKAERASQKPTSGGYFNNLGTLRTLGLIDYPSPGEVAALPALVLEGTTR